MCHSGMCSGKCRWAHKVAWALILIGALNWGLVGIFNFDLVAAIFGDMSAVARIIYILVGAAAVYKLVIRCHGCKGACKDGKCGPSDTKADACCGGHDHDHSTTA